MQNLLVYSSLLFVSNFLHAYRKGYFFYGTLFYLLTVTSILVHGFFPNNLTINLLDKIPIVCIVITGFLVFLGKLIKTGGDLASSWPMVKKIVYSSIIVSTFLFVVYIYCCGYQESKYCFDVNKSTSNEYHALLHLVSSLGHHAIIFM